MNSYNVKHHRTLTYNPQGNSIIERSHSDILNGLRCTSETHIDKALLRINDAHNSTFHTTLNCSPLQLAFGKSKFTPNILENTSELLAIANSNKAEMSEKRLIKKNKSRIPTVFLNQKVMVRNLDKTKLTPPFLGPYKVIEEFPEYNSVTVDIDGEDVRYTYREIKPFKEEEGVVPTTL